MDAPLRENPDLKVPPVDPIEPGTAVGLPLEHPPGRASESCSGLMLFLGLLSLFMCGPLGMIAWVMASGELRRIREGKLPNRHAGTLRLGRALGIIGTFIFIVTVVSVAVLLHRGFPTLESLIKSEPLAPQHIAFAGEWFGNKGTYIAIRANGSGDYKSRHSTVRGGRVAIDKESLEIGVMGFSKKWRIERPPHVENGNWSMVLDGEVFVRMDKGDLV